jgi:hypothetical protein
MSSNSVPRNPFREIRSTRDPCRHPPPNELQCAYAETAVQATSLQTSKGCKTWQHRVAGDVEKSRWPNTHLALARQGAYNKRLVQEPMSLRKTNSLNQQLAQSATHSSLRRACTCCGRLLVVLIEQVDDGNRSDGKSMKITISRPSALDALPQCLWLAVLGPRSRCR